VGRRCAYCLVRSCIVCAALLDQGIFCRACWTALRLVVRFVLYRNGNERKQKKVQIGIDYYRRQRNFKMLVSHSCSTNIVFLGQR
jgi:hypothetical protein